MFKNPLFFSNTKRDEWIIFGIILIFFPIHMILYFIGLYYYRKRFNLTYNTRIALVVINMISLLLFVYFSFKSEVFRNRQFYEVTNYILFFFGKSKSNLFEILLQNFNLERVGISLIGFNMIYLESSLAELKLKRHTEYKDEKRYKATGAEKRENEIDFGLPGNIFFMGAPGSGKTANILRYIEYHLKRNSFIGVLDGKGTDAEYGLAWTVERLAKKYNRKLYTIDQTNIDQSNAYNPFYNVKDETQIKDMLLSMCDFSEEFYKTQCARFWQALAQVLIRANMPISFRQLVYYSNDKHFSDLIRKCYKQEIIGSNEYDHYEQICKSCITTVMANVGRFSVIQEGAGKNIFRDENAIKFETALKENAIILFKLNNFKYPEFSRELGKLAIQDLKNMMATCMNIPELMNIEKFIVMDELHVYFDENTMQIINMGRDCSVTAGLATQGVSDVSILNDKLLGRIIDNCNNYVIMRVNDDASAEKMASIIGTKKEVSTTYQTSDRSFGTKGTIKEIDQFKVHPNYIKELPINMGYFYSKRKTRMNVKPFKTEFVKVD